MSATLSTILAPLLPYAVGATFITLYVFVHIGIKTVVDRWEKWV